MNANEILSGGGLLPPGAAPEGARVDTVDARTYAHPALEGRVVVRLVPDVSAQGADAEMEAMGFAMVAHADDIAVQSRRALGFPGQVLVRHPKHARLVLGMMKEFQAEARRAATKPGHARDGFTALSKRLDKAPEALPSFWEEVGRVFSANGNTQYASQAFDRARTAEIEHGLVVEPEAQAEAWLEFAQAGALSVKSLQARAKELARSAGAESAYEQLFELVVRRSGAGLAPWAGMAKDLRALAKAAGRDVDAEDELLIDALVGTPGAAKAGDELWKPWKDALLRRSRTNPAFRARLLALLPEPRKEPDEWWPTWIGLLEEAGALDGLSAGWISRLLEKCPLVPRKVHEAMTRNAARLRAEGEAIRLHGKEVWDSLDLALMDTALGLGIPLADPDMEECWLNLPDWTSGEVVQDPVHLGADPRFRKMLQTAVVGAIGDGSVEARIAGMSTFEAARREWLESHLAAGSQGLPALADDLDELERRLTPGLMGLVPGATERIAATDVAGALMRTLRGGILDELAWPEFEAACEALGGSKANLQVSAAWPDVYVCDGRRVRVLGPRPLDLDLRLPKGSEVRGFSRVGDDLLVVYRDKDYNELGLWSSRPKDGFEVEGGWDYDSDDRVRLELGDGRVSEGGGAFRAGDHPLPSPRRGLLFDGRRMWEDGEERDPLTGSVLGKGLPSMFSEEDQNRVLLPAEGGLLGAKDGLYWFRVRGDLAEASDGRHASTAGLDVGALVDLPGQRVAMVDIDQDRPTLATVGTAMVLDRPEDDALPGAWRRFPPRIAWTRLEHRDVPGSERLRALDAEQARRLLESGRAWLPEEVDDDTDTGALLDAVMAITGIEGGLAAGVARAVALAAALERRLARLLARLRGEVEAEDTDGEDEDPLDDGAFRTAFGSFAPCNRWANENFARFVAAAGAFLEGGPAPSRLPRTEVDWEKLCGASRGLAWALLCVGAPEEHRGADLLTAWARSPLGKGIPGLARLRLRLPRRDHPFVKQERDEWSEEMEPAPAWASLIGEDRLWCWEPEAEGEDDEPVEFNVLARGRALPDGATIVEERAVAARDDSAWIERFLALLAERGRPAWNPVIAETLAARTGMGKVEASVIVAGLPGIEDYRSDWLGKPLREALGLKQAEVKAVKELVSGYGNGRLLPVFDAAMPEDPAGLWDNPAAFGEALAAAWTRAMGTRVAIPPELLLALTKELNLEVDTSTLLEALAKGELPPPGTWRLTEDGTAAAQEGADCLDEAWAQALAVALPWLAMRLSPEDPLRANLGRLHTAASTAARDPERVSNLDSWYAYEAREQRQRDAFWKAAGGEVRVARTGEGESAREVQIKDDGVLILARDADGDLQVSFRPARAAGNALVEKLARSLESASPIVEAWRRLASPELEALVQSAARGEALWQPPPDLVAEVSAARGLSEDAARLWLQLLVLAEPTSKNLQTWNGWTPARLKKAGAELLTLGVLVEAKRARAGRELFLPGGWDARKGPELPLETWKKQFYPCDEEGDPILGAFVPTRPTADLFRHAWTLVMGGKGP